MNANTGSSTYNDLLARLLRRFDEIDKEELALQIVQSLNLEQDGEPYPDQVARRLSRDLSADEAFKLDVLDRILNFHTGEESEEEEE